MNSAAMLSLTVFCGIAVLSLLATILYIVRIPSHVKSGAGRRLSDPRRAVLRPELLTETGLILKRRLRISILILVVASVIAAGHGVAILLLG